MAQQSTDNQAPSESPIVEPLWRQLLPVRRSEAEAVVLSILYHFLVQGGWNVLKPIRDEMSIAGGTRNIPWMYTATMVGTLIATPIFAALAARTKRHVFIPVTYAFIGGSIAALFVAFSMTEGDANAWVGRVFFVWASVFNMFLFALFWGFMADIWSSERSTRVFGLIGVGGTAGVLGGSFLVGQFAEALGLTVLVTVFAVSMALAIVVVLRLASLFRLGGERSSRDVLDPRSTRGVAGEPSRDMLAGFKAIVRSPYLLGICASVVAHTIIGTFLWIMRTKLAEQALDDPAERIAFFANITLYANLITIGIQLLLFRVISRQFGVALMLALVPSVALVGFGLIEILPAFGYSALGVVFWVQVLRRGLHYAVSKPAREILYTVVGADEKYKSKSFIDTFVYRGGDAVGSWMEKGIGAIGLAVGSVAIPIAAVWLIINLVLGREQKRRADREPRFDFRCCLGCEYPLAGLRESVCPECGRDVSPEIAEGLRVGIDLRDANSAARLTTRRSDG